MNSNNSCPVPYKTGCPKAKPRALDKENEADGLIGQAKQLKVSIRAKVERAFWVIKR